MMTSTERIVPGHRATSHEVCRIGRVAVVDNCQMIQAGIRRLLAQPCFAVDDCQDSTKVNSLPMMMLHHRIDLVIMELSGDRESILDGLRVINQFQGTWPLTPLIACTSRADARLLKQLVAMGVAGIYLKKDPLSALTQCVLQVMDGGYSYSPQAEALIGSQKASSMLLTFRELDVLECLFTGKNVTSTALSLHRDIRTISTHKRNSMAKLGFHNDCELYTWGAGLSRQGAAL